MKKLLYPLIFAQIILIQSIIYSSEIEKVEHIEKKFQFKNPDAENTIIVDNVFGSVKLSGYSGDEIYLKVRKKIKAHSENKETEARQKIKLDITEEDDLIEFYVDGPFRDHNRGSVSWRGYEHSGYLVYFDFELNIPVNTKIEIKTVNNGDITIQNISGDYIVNNVNGSIDMDKISGSGDVYTVNGSVDIDFDKNPKSDCRFGTLNGKVKLNFLPDLTADFQLKTFNGEFYSDFPFSYLPTNPKVLVKENHRTTYKIERTTNVRIGNGGPTIKLDGFNGDMYLLNKE